MRCILCCVTLLAGALILGGAPPVRGGDKPAQKEKKSAPATIEVRLPASAELFFDDAPTTQRGGVRLFATPLLESGYKYSYQLTARWQTPEGKEHKESRQIIVRAGERTTVDLLPAKK